MANFERLIEISKALRSKRPYNKQFHTCFVMDKNRIVQIGINDYRKSHPRNLRGNYLDEEGNDRRTLIGTHAECDALIKLNKSDCRDFTFVNIRITPGNQVGYSCFCNGCLSLIEKVGYRKLYYSYDESGRFAQLH